jgi:hypothetical protein
MYSLNQVKKVVSCGRDPARSLPLRRGFLLIPLILVCLALTPQMRAQGGEGDIGGGNTVEGFNALFFLPGAGGGFNTGIGWFSGAFTTTGFFNSYLGAGSGDLNTIGSSNTALGTAALLLSGDGNENTAVGTDALLFSGFGISGADFNDAVGAFALFNNGGGFENNAMGNSAMFFNILGANNTAVGDLAAESNDSDGLGLANNNVAVGGQSLIFNIDGSENTAVGAGSGPNVLFGFNNTYVGDFVGTLAFDESSTIRIGDLSNGNGAGSLECFIGGIFNNFQPVNGVNVVQVTLNLDDDHLGWDFGPNGNGAAPAPRAAPQPRSAPQRHDRALSQHQALNNKVENLEATVAQQQKQIETLTAQLKEQAEQIQKVSAQLEMVRPAPRVVNNQ